MPVLALIVFFVSIATFIMMGVDARKRFYDGRGLNRALTITGAVIGSFGVLCGSLLWFMRSPIHRTGRDMIVLIVSIVCTALLVVIPLLQ